MSVIFNIGIKHKKFFQFLYDNADISQAVDRVCKFCLVIKPPRSHHCRICRRCILKMDHHCKFVNNCIGYRNYKFFVVFLFYTTITLMFILINMIDGFKLYFKNYGWGTMECNIFILGYIYILSVFIKGQSPRCISFGIFSASDLSRLRSGQDHL